MAKDNKSIQLPMKIGISISAIVYIAYLLSRESVFRETVLSGALYLLTLILLVFALCFMVALFRKATWLSAITSAFMVYLGLMIILFSVNKDIVPEIPNWDVSMTGVGIAVIVFGLVIFTQYEQAQTKEKSEELGTDGSGLSEKVEALNEKFNKLENVIDKTFEKFTEELNKMHKEDKSEGNATKK